MVKVLSDTWGDGATFRVGPWGTVSAVPVSSLKFANLLDTDLVDSDLVDTDLVDTNLAPYLFMAAATWAFPVRISWTSLMLAGQT